MTIQITQAITDTQQADILNKYNSHQTISAEQFPGFAQLVEPDAAVYYALAYNNDSLCGYCVFQIKNRLLASIYYGPIADNNEDYVTICNAIIAFCRKKLSLVLKIHPPFFADESRAKFENYIKNHLSFELNNQELNWNTVLLNLQIPEEELVKQFNENHRRSLKKAVKMELYTQVIDDISMIDVFNRQYCDTYESRNLAINRDLSKRRFQGLFNFFQATDSGLFLVVKEADAVIGGVCIVFQGNAARYLMGYAHPDFRKHPINHTALFNAMKLARDRGFKFFDLGGYAANPVIDEQLQAINRFKDGFGGVRQVYPPTMIFSLLPGGKSLLNLLLKVKQLIGR